MPLRQSSARPLTREYMGPGVHKLTPLQILTLLGGEMESEPVSGGTGKMQAQLTHPLNRHGLLLSKTHRPPRLSPFHSTFSLLFTCLSESPQVLLPSGLKDLLNVSKSYWIQQASSYEDYHSRGAKTRR